MLAKNSPFSLLALTLFFLIARLSEGAETLEADLDAFITLPDAYRIQPADLETMFDKGKWNRNPYFKWLTTDHSRAIFQRKKTQNLKVNLTLLEGSVPIEEAIVDFKDGTFVGVTISIFNRGDGGTIDNSDFQERFKLMGSHLGRQLEVRPKRRKAKPTIGLLTDGWIWISARGKAVLEHNHEAPDPTEFLRMRLARRDAEGAYEAATHARPGATAKLSDLPRRVKRNPNGDVFIEKIPMVDQGTKGYCVVASAQRVFEYYGISCDMHQLAQLAGSTPEGGTSGLAINEELGAIDHLFKTRFECLAMRNRSSLVELLDGKYVGDRIPDEDFFKMIYKNIEDGIPLLWALTVGQFEETPPLQEQTGGGHMRLIIGFNKKTNRIIFSDSWGAGHEFKTMDAGDALNATSGLFLLKPVLR
ncbi:MAG: C39 family peptidase [Verrucomicrobiales bacterium]|nr:C39 family peptidase [Verrucomicrobiales bacterium]